MSQRSEPDSSPVSNFGEQVRLRRERLRIKQDQLASAAGIKSRDTITAIEHGGGSAAYQRRVDEALTKMEEEAGFKAEPLTTPTPAPANAPEDHPQVIRFEVQGVYGAKALIVEGPPENIAELEEMVDRIMRRLAGEQGDENT